MRPQGRHMANALKREMMLAVPLIFFYLEQVLLDFRCWSSLIGFHEI